MAVFPESMNKLDLGDAEGSLRTLENYVRYMTERVEFNNRNMVRTVGSSEMSTLEVAEMLVTLASAVSILQSTVSSMQSSINAAGSKADEAKEAADAVAGTASEAKATADAAKSAANAAAAHHVSGTYDGNGDTTERTVNVGGEGGALLVYDGTGIMATVTAAGMHYMSSTTTPTFKDATVAAFANGVLTLKTGSYINAADRTYTYQII